jgi:hypothetical protein
LAVSLINSTTFVKRALYKNAALFTGPPGCVCGFAIEQPERENDALGRLTVFFDAKAPRELQLTFLRYVNRQLERLAFAGTLRRDRVYQCKTCGYVVPNDVVVGRRKRGFKTIVCPIDDEQNTLDELAEEVASSDPVLDALDENASLERIRQALVITLAERERAGQFQVFLCHNAKDKSSVRAVESRLRHYGILAWFDEQVVQAGDRFAPAVEKAITSVRVIAVLVGPSGIGRWQRLEYDAALQRVVEGSDVAGRSEVRLIPVMLPGVDEQLQLPAFLRGMDQVDLRDLEATDSPGLRKLVMAIHSTNAPYQKYV